MSRLPRIFRRSAFAATIFAGAVLARTSTEDEAVVDAISLVRHALTERGWNIVVRAPWPRAPPYAAFDEPARDGMR